MYSLFEYTKKRKKSKCVIDKVIKKKIIIFNEYFCLFHTSNISFDSSNNMIIVMNCESDYLCIPVQWCLMLFTHSTTVPFFSHTHLIYKKWLYMREQKKTVVHDEEVREWQQLFSVATETFSSNF